jgi:hypothetical protein
VDLLDRHLMDGRFGFRESLKQLPGAVASPGGQRGTIDEPEDLRKTAVRMMVVVMIVMLMIVGMAVIMGVTVIMSMRCRVLRSWRCRVLWF